jgi:hypothetical protein
MKLVLLQLNKLKKKRTKTAITRTARNSLPPGIYECKRHKCLEVKSLKRSILLCRIDPYSGKFETMFSHPVEIDASWKKTI